MTAASGRSAVVVDGIELPRYVRGGRTVFLQADLARALGGVVFRWRQVLPRMVDNRRYALRDVVEGQGRRQRQLFTLDGAAALCGASSRPAAQPLFHELTAQINRIKGLQPAPVAAPSPSSPPVEPTPCMVLQRLPSSMDCAGVALPRYAAGGEVWLLGVDLDCLAGFWSWPLRRRNAALTGQRMRLAGGNMHPRLAFTLPVVREMALLSRGPAAQALFELTSAEIAAGRHFFSGASE